MYPDMLQLMLYRMLHLLHTTEVFNHNVSSQCCFRGT